MYKKTDYSSFFLILICLVLLVGNLIVLKFHQPVGYVIDIYSLLPFSFYFALILCYFFSAILLFKNNIKIATFILVLVHIEVLIIPYMFGYFSMGRADEISHLGIVDQIMKTGFLSPNNIYPAMHTTASILALITNIQTNIIEILVFPIFTSFMFIAGMIIFSRQFIDKSDIYYIAILSSFFFYFSHFHFAINPHYFFFCMIPLYLFCLSKYLKDKNLSVAIPWVLLILLTPFTHPFIFLFFFFIIIIIIIPTQLFKLKLADLKTNLILLSTCFAFWFISNKRYLQNLRGIYTSYTREITEPVFLETTEKLSKINLDFFQFVKFINLYYGRYYIPTIFILISIFIIYKNRARFNELFIKKYSTLLILYVALFALEGIFMFNRAISHQPDRLTNLNFVVFAQVPLFAYSLYLIFLRNSRSKRNIFIVLFILTLVWSLSVFGCFSSPYIYKPNEALTYNEVTGMEWFYQTKGNYPVGAPISQMGRFPDLLGKPRCGSKRPPGHFGYNMQTENFAQINLEPHEQVYIVIPTIDELLYQKVPGFTETHRYNESDFKRFRNDPSVSKIYDSLNIEIFKSTRRGD